jgi:hypothetical protein
MGQQSEGGGIAKFQPTSQGMIEPIPLGKGGNPSVWGERHCFHPGSLGPALGDLLRARRHIPRDRGIFQRISSQRDQPLASGIKGQ